MSTQTLASKQKTALIVGGRSWIGYRVSNQLAANGVECLLTTSKSTANIRDSNSLIGYVTADSPEKIDDIITTTKPDVIFNLLLGIDEHAYHLHQTILKAANKFDSYLVFASSALALDGYENMTLTDNLKPLSNSPYGKFKSRCERDLLQQKDLNSLVVRFSSIHGYSPWKKSRTVLFLEKLSRSIQVKVDRGVIQNRLTDVDLANLIARLTEHKRTGVVHLGTSDSSEEFAFLSDLAEEFGYSRDLIISGDDRNLNLDVIPSEIREVVFNNSELETIKKLARVPELQKYKKQTA